MISPVKPGRRKLVERSDSLARIMKRYVDFKMMLVEDSICCQIVTSI